MSLRLNDRHALVTGANGGIAIAVIRAYLAEGAFVSGVDRGEESDAFKQLKVEYPNQLHYQSLDVCDTEAIKVLVSERRAEQGVIDILFNNAAVFDMAPFLESDEAMYQHLFDVNVKGMFFTLQAVAQQLVDAGVKGSLINLSSQAGRRGEGLVAHYCASKAAVISYTQSAAMAFAEQGIRVNSISPGVIDTPMWEQVDSLFARYENLQKGEKKAAVGKAVPLGRMGVPQDIAGAAVFLASDESAYITAQTLNVDGGNVMS